MNHFFDIKQIPCQIPTGPGISVNHAILITNDDFGSREHSHLLIITLNLNPDSGIDIPNPLTLIPTNGTPLPRPFRVIKINCWQGLYSYEIEFL
jgi:hypothetical protein